MDGQDKRKVPAHIPCLGLACLPATQPPSLMDGRQRGQPFAPPPNTVQKGVVTRLEPYGLFVQLSDYRGRGLVHRSQLARFRVENVEDCASVGDAVWVKVVEVTEEVDGETGRTRHRIGLSMKHADQEDGTDLDPTGEGAAEEARRRGDGGSGGDGGGRRGGPGGAPGDAAAAALEQRLGSSIGLGAAIDPMAAAGRLVLRGSRGAAAGGPGAATFNGYALVGDDEGEPDLTPAPLPAAAAAAAAAAAPSAAEARPPSRPMGRGRGTTLPAWMTRDEGPKGAGGEGGMPKRRSRSISASSRSPSSGRDGGRRRRRRKDSKRSSKHKRSHRDRHRRRYRKQSRSRSRSRSRESRDRGRRERKRDRRSRRRSRSRSYSRSRSRSRSSDRSCTSDDPSGQFASVDEARALIARLEKKEE